VTEKQFFEIQYDKLLNLVAGLASAAVGMMLVNLGLTAIFQTSDFLLASNKPLMYSCLGFGLVFLVTSVFFIRDAFREGFFKSTTRWPDGFTFCTAMVLLWGILYCITIL